MHGRHGAARAFRDDVVHLDEPGTVAEGATVMVTAVYGFADAVIDAG